MKIAVVTGSRSEYGLLRPILSAINKNPKLKSSLIVTGMHLSKQFGYTVKDIEKDGFKIDAKIPISLSKDSVDAMAKSIGELLTKIVGVLRRIKPDIILIFGDRAEILAVAVAGVYMNIPIAHIHSGDKSIGGHLDDYVRHAIAKLSHIHFEATEKCAERLIKMGEEKERVYVVGSPAVDAISRQKLQSKKTLSHRYNLDLNNPLLLVVQNPVTTEVSKSGKQIEETMEALVKLKLQSIVIYPNADAGARRMINVIKKYGKYPFIKVYENLPHEDYLSLLSVASVLLGNSTSGIIEAPSFRLPVVNIGSRQGGRERSTNVIDVGYDRKKIVKAVKKALHNKKFRNKVKRCKNVYGDGKSSQRIVKVLSKIKITPKLLQKKITY